MKKVLQLLLISIITIVSSCKKNEVTTTPDPIVPFEAGKTITTVVAGKVTAQDGTALNNVEITIGTSTTVTDANGNFIIPKATLSEKAGFIKATKSGYFGGSRTIIAKEKVVNNIVIQLVKKTISGDFTNANGGTITVATGGSVVFPANAVATKSGAAYSGTVKVSAYFLDPTSSNCYKEMPGDLRGINASNNEQILTSYGMMAVELNGSNGEALQLATGKNATVTFPITAATQSAAPASIPLWFFDETKGMWVEQGSATKTGNTYVSTVSHFTWWNVNAGFPIVNYTVKFVDQNGNAIENAYVRLNRLNTAVWLNSTLGQTASDGTISGAIPYNETLGMFLYLNRCMNDSIQLPNIGPFTQDANGGVITITIPSNNAVINIKGTIVDCNNVPILNGYAAIKFNNYTIYSSIVNGTLNTSYDNCLGVIAGTASIEVFDLKTLQQNATPVLLNITGAGTFNIGQVAACGLKNFVHYTVKYIDQNGNSIPSSLLRLYCPDSTIPQITQNGIVNSVVPVNKAIKTSLRIDNACGASCLLDSSQIGPLFSDFDAGTITVSLPLSYTFKISGIVNDCSGNILQYGRAFISFDGSYYETDVIQGAFSQQITRCNNVTPANAIINVIDYQNKQQNSNPIIASITNTNTNIGTIQSCGLSTNEFYNFNFNNVSYAGYTTYSFYPANNTNYINTNFSSIYSNFSRLSSSFAGSSLGTTPFSINLYGGAPISYYSPNGFTADITEYGAVGQYIAGNFSGNLVDSLNSNIKPISGSFRFRRTQ